MLELASGSSSGLVFEGSPPKLSGITDESGLRSAVSPQSLVNHYVDSLELPGLIVTNIPDAQQLAELLVSNSALSRKLILSSRMPTVNAAEGCYYAHQLPVGEITVTFSSFPARVETVPPNSPMAGKMHPGQAVVSVNIPGQPALTSSSSGFTGSRVMEYLNQHSHVPNRQIVLKSAAVQYTTKYNSTSDAAFECCTIA